MFIVLFRFCFGHPSGLIGFTPWQKHCLVEAEDRKASVTLEALEVSYRDFVGSQYSKNLKTEDFACAVENLGRMHPTLRSYSIVCKVPPPDDPPACCTYSWQAKQLLREEAKKKHVFSCPYLGVPTTAAERRSVKTQLAKLRLLRQEMDLVDKMNRKKARAGAKKKKNMAPQPRGNPESTTAAEYVASAEAVDPEATLRIGLIKCEVFTIDEKDLRLTMRGQKGVRVKDGHSIQPDDCIDAYQLLVVCVDEKIPDSVSGVFNRYGVDFGRGLCGSALPGYGNGMTRWINHFAVNPHSTTEAERKARVNVVLMLTIDERGKRMVHCQAIKYIGSGQELFVDYGEDYVFPELPKPKLKPKPKPKPVVSRPLGRSKLL
jgi:hypothetical protein